MPDALAFKSMTTRPRSTIEIFRVPLSKDQLRSVPVDDRNLLLLASHAVNQLSVLRKILVFSTNHDSKSELENTLSAAQSLMVSRFLFGTLAETWEMIKRPVNQRLIGKDYAREIEPDGVVAYEKLKKHFGETNLLHLIRNQVAYHYPENAELAAAFEEVPDDEDWAWYPSDTTDNSYYLASDFVISTHILKLTGEPDMESAAKKVLGLAVPVSNDLIDFLLYVMRAIVTRHLDVKLLAPQRGEGVTFENVPNFFEVTIPFFTFRDK
ncbi:hypothetical protein [Methylocystis sp.]|uniref:hypothetical protein n=1 Tax=Methylocystis sp. TaxID=1911079 RepID=UPI003D0A41C4